jgi:hypothetical protein
MDGMAPHDILKTDEIQERAISMEVHGYSISGMWKVLFL